MPIIKKKIHLLSTVVANQIAAGEVVQRPASIAKELLENALDADSTDIQLIVEGAGKKCVQVVDNGYGMNKVDAPMAFERHATSKIENAADLFNIHTYGFRGEAMPSIASIAQVEVITRTAEDELGTHLLVEASGVKKQTPIVAPIGTNIAVFHCFQNVPVRRNFLKSNHVEMRHILAEFQRVALARPDVACTLLQDGKVIWKLPPAKLSQRIVDLLGKKHLKQLIPCEGKTEQVTLHGYIGPPNQSTKKKIGQFLFVNKRYVRNHLLSHAIKQGFGSLLPPNTFPFYVLFLELPPDQVDVNVHPKKTEVKFEHESLLYALVQSSVQKALATHQCMHTIDFEAPSTKAIFENSDLITATPPADITNFSTFSKQAAQDGVANKQTTSLDKQIKLAPPTTKKEAKASSTPEATLDKLQVHDQYILTQVKSGLLIMKQAAALERILYERNLRFLKEKGAPTQKLLFPHPIALQPADAALIQACREELYALGFRFTQPSPSELTIIGQPAHLQSYHIPPKELFLDSLETYNAYQQTEWLSTQEKWARALAKRTKLKKQQKLTPEEVHSLVDQLFSCQNPNYTPEGMPIWRIVSLEELGHLLETPIVE